MERRRGTFMSGLKNSWVNHSKTTAGFLLMIVSGALAMGGLVAVYYDLSASYYGWGKLVETEINLPYAEYLAYVATILPTLLQMAYYYALVADHEIAKHAGVQVTHWTMWIMDTFLDVYQMNTGTNRSLLISSVTAIVLFGFVSEFLITFFGSVFIGTLWSKINSPDLWSPGKSRDLGESKPQVSRFSRPRPPDRPREPSRARPRASGSGRPSMSREEH